MTEKQPSQKLRFQRFSSIQWRFPYESARERKVPAGGALWPLKTAFFAVRRPSGYGTSPCLLTGWEGL